MATNSRREWFRRAQAATEISNELGAKCQQYLADLETISKLTKSWAPWFWKLRKIRILLKKYEQPPQ